MDTLELWGGPECTVNRVGDHFRDQLRETGHHDRLPDLDLFAELGISALRYPVLWERVSPHRPDSFDWSWSDARLARICELGMRPIAGLVHHGSGPAYTNLLADNFAPGLAQFAGAVAARYPWIEDWTPVNEPVTTARFSALYGLWYPHHCDERSFWLALLNQIDGVRLAMTAVRAVNPAARLIQTDDLGRTYATAAMGDQAAFDNVRRWMSWDLLCGRVVPGHPLWRRLCTYGFEPRLRSIAEAPCPPDVIGVNHYLTSDRFLDHRIQRYPAHLRGGNGAKTFADTEAVRVLDPPPPGLRGVLREAWARYGIPLAVTEVHNGCTREEQMRWVADAWQTARELRAEGIEIGAVTSWAMFGNRGWNTLLTASGEYEPGVFDVSGGMPHPTALAALLKTLVAQQETHPAARGAGWWRRKSRLLHPSVARPAPMRDRHIPRVERFTPSLLLAGKDLDELATVCRHRGLAYRLADPADEAGATAVLAEGPWAVIASGDAYGLLVGDCAERGITIVDGSSCKSADALLDKMIDCDACAQPMAA
ncbi:dTDP-4-dehydrorhamnose reductase [Sphingomonas crusticola]|uniref:dTDP-4-dehydrorhamnose reductase n=1 Tax=Sphingomonas crusticola TaxID=1697973 RepID=UPI000E280BB2|nr:dTDP-4-dehydrorhamnose reductase [Sphingomonas crusticola]